MLMKFHKKIVFIQRTLTRRALITITNELRKPSHMQPPHWTSVLERNAGWRGVREPVNVWGIFLAKRCIHKCFDSVLNSHNSCYLFSLWGRRCNGLPFYLFLSFFFTFELPRLLSKTMKYHACSLACSVPIQICLLSVIFFLALSTIYNLL